MTTSWLCLGGLASSPFQGGKIKVLQLCILFQSSVFLGCWRHNSLGKVMA